MTLILRFALTHPPWFFGNCHCRIFLCWVFFSLLGRARADAPVSVAVETGPDHGSLFVSWLPVTISSSNATSNGLLVAGYNVYVNGIRVKQILNPTGKLAVCHFIYEMCLGHFGIGLQHCVISRQFTALCHLI